MVRARSPIKAAGLDSKSPTTKKDVLNNVEGALILSMIRDDCFAMMLSTLMSLKILTAWIISLIVKESRKSPRNLMNTRRPRRETKCANMCRIASLKRPVWHMICVNTYFHITRRKRNTRSPRRRSPRIKRIQRNLRELQGTRVIDTNLSNLSPFGHKIEIFFSIFILNIHAAKSLTKHFE